VERAEISHLAHADHPVAGPLGDDTVERLLRLALAGSRRVLDLGCGDGTWLLRALQLQDDVTAVGVDLSDAGFDAVRAAARERGVADRLELIRADARTYVSPEPVDLVLCVGSTHAFGGLAATLDACRGHLRDDGRVLVGEGFWERAPEPRVLELLEATMDDYGDLAATVSGVVDDGWLPLHGHASTQQEWDDYEWAWTGSLTRWALEHPGHPDSGQVLAVAEEHRRMWLEGYRGTLGFVTLLLRRQP
jgi:SAM-dependent methyltransferase